MKKIALFDFDKTLTTEDTIILLWRYARDLKKTDRLEYANKILKGSFGYILKKDLKFFKNQICQVIHLFTEEELEQFADYVYENHMLKDGLKALKNLEVEYKMLVSASPQNYLKYFNKYLNFDVVIGTDLDKFCNILNENNKSYEKVRRINEHLKEKGFEIDYETSMCFSDSYSADRPMFEMVKNRYLINSRKKIEGYENLNWK
ncbi:Phosphoserine phosphatase [Peptoniphilus asaccharolyticus DSM 20463]|uniref:Phosphoserine phosphatase n=1 Tax=Peptoniphilus asaccharolyticus DSM 20463 TaxID=573058 RepID=A0A1W1VCA0_PEPAS|nr:HAD family hydrolase [Peptoniphilus asaccharolyticus]MBL7575608.1 haloacid dehalogenase-like hydrolase [Peptoniphilus asaccharolyticus]SMB90998.1 Phosphoserine phosphatase [Peptoniphilus asaccharolyticus DSM 20463]